MTKSKTTKKAWLASVLSLLLCFAMLIGTTFAWFTDTVTSGNNKIVAGNLDVELYVRGNNGAYTDKVGENTNLFKDDALWEPGHVEVAYLKVVNEGTLALKYQFSIGIESQTEGTNVNGEKFKLSDYLRYGVVVTDEAKTFTGDTEAEKRDAAIKAVATNAVSLTTPYKSGDTTLYPKEKGTSEKYVALVVYMPYTVGNEANYRGNNAPQINMNVNLVATQVPYESDSFDENYDEEAEFADYYVKSNEQLKEAIKEAKAGDVIVATAGEYELSATDKIPEGVSITGENGTVLTVAGDGGNYGLLIGSDNVTISNVTLKGENIVNDQNSAFIKITGNNVTIDNVTISNEETVVSPIIIANTSNSDNVITIKNCNINVKGKAIYVINGAKGTINIDRCNIDALYPFNEIASAGIKALNVSNSALNGWTSYGANVEKATFSNCRFGKGHNQNLVMAYTHTVFNNCDFADGFIVATKNGYANTMEFDNCRKNGTKLTASNLLSYFGGSDSDDINNAGWTVLVDGENVTM